jgi:hypothetical protein
MWRGWLLIFGEGEALVCLVCSRFIYHSHAGAHVGAHAGAHIEKKMIFFCILSCLSVRPPIWAGPDWTGFM